MTIYQENTAKLAQDLESLLPLLGKCLTLLQLDLGKRDDQVSELIRQVEELHAVRKQDMQSIKWREE